MRIEIDTDGLAAHTSIVINGRELKNVKEFKFSVAVVHTGKNGRKVGGACKMQILREAEDGRVEPLEYYKDGFGKFDEENLWKEAGHVGDGKSKRAGREVH